MLNISTLGQRCRINLHYFFDKNQLKANGWMDRQTELQTVYPIFFLKSVDAKLLNEILL